MPMLSSGIKNVEIMENEKLVRRLGRYLALNQHKKLWTNCYGYVNT